MIFMKKKVKKKLEKKLEKILRRKLKKLKSGGMRPGLEK